MKEGLQTESLSLFRIFYCTNVMRALIFLLLLQLSVRSLAQPNWTAVKAKMTANSKELGDDYVFIVASPDSVLLSLQSKTFTTKTQAPIAGSSQWLTAALLFKLAEQGKISLDDPVQKFIPEFGKYFKGYITIRQCLSNMTGIEPKEMSRTNGFKKKYTTLEEQVSDIAKLTIRAKPGTECWFNPWIGINIAGRVAEIATKKRFDGLIKSTLFVPLGMTRTSFSPLGGSAIDPSSGAQTTAEDYLRFLRMLLHKGKVNQQSFLSDSSVNALLQLQASASQVVYSPFKGRSFGYAYGAWVIEENMGVPTSLSAPGMQGSWSMIDRCRGYAYLLITKNNLEEDKAYLHVEMKSLIDQQLTSTCK